MALSIANFNQQIPFFSNSSFNELANSKVPKGHPRGLGATDVEEYKNGWNVNIDTPGLSEADISIQTDGNLLTVSGQRTSEKITEKDDEDSGCYESICERTFGKFTRSFNIGDDANADAITAKLDHGVIHIHIPKKKEQSAIEPPRRIPIRGRSKSPLAGMYAREKSPIIHARGRSKSPAGKTAKTPQLLPLQERCTMSQVTYNQYLRQPPNKPPSTAQAEKSVESLLVRYPGAPRIENQPVYSRADVSHRDGRDKQDLWVTYKDGVYDVTDFQKIHPGGINITKAAGGPIDSFWAYWFAHHLSPKAHAFMEKLRIGTLLDWEATPEKEECPYNSDPKRGDGQFPLMPMPWCSETYTHTMKQSYLTKNEAFYVRNHAPVPKGPEDLNDFDISFISTTKGDSVETDHTLADLLKKYEKVTITSILQCAGNRAADSIAIHNGGGFIGTPLEKIGIGMLGNATWSGVRITDVLQDMFPGQYKENAGQHVLFEGADGYSSSVPVALLGPDCIFATEMNGEILPPDHGYPVRTLLPGIAGARSVKWVNTVTLLESETSTPWNAAYYKKESAGNKQSIYVLPLQSVILEPVKLKTHGSKREAHVTGVACNGSGAKITTVEVSTNEGESWNKVKIVDTPPSSKEDKQFGWVRWEGLVDVSNSTEIHCRATDDTGLTQPQVAELNGGYLYNGWHKVPVPTE